MDGIEAETMIAYKSYDTDAIVEFGITQNEGNYRTKTSQKAKAFL